MPIRWRLTLWFSLILLVILLVVGAAIQASLYYYLSNEVDDNLKIYSARVHGTLDPVQIPEPLDYGVIHSKLPPINEFTSPGIYVQVIDTNGSVVVKSDNLGDQELPVDPLLLERGFDGEVVLGTVAAGEGARVRVMVSPLFLTDETLLLEVGHSLNHVQGTMTQAGWALAISIFIALTLAVISGAVLVRRTLSPVRNVTRIAQKIEASSDLSRRVGYKGAKDEIGELATTFDHMIEHLDRTFESQKHFVEHASHELRSPLTVLRGNLDLLKRNLSEEEHRESLKVMEGEIERMAKTVSDLLLLADVESGQLELQEKVALREILQEGLRRAQQSGGNHRISIDRQEDLYVKGDTYLLSQLLWNLIDNAIRYTSDGGIITLSLFRDGDWARLEVTDAGIGIAPEHLPYVFDRFFRVDKARSRIGGGTGLGLTIVKGIAGQHGGRVTVTSEPGKGSTFTAWLKL